jgi:hypothetical protein
MASRHQRVEPVESYSYYLIPATAASRTQLPTAQAGSGPALDLGHGQVLARVVVGDPGATQVLTLYNGNTTNVVAVIKPTAAGFFDFGCLLEGGLWYTLSAGTLGSITLIVAPLAA